MWNRVENGLCDGLVGEVGLGFGDELGLFYFIKILNQKIIFNKNQLM